MVCYTRDVLRSQVSTGYGRLATGDNGILLNEAYIPIE